MKKTMIAAVSLGLLMTACKKEETTETSCEGEFCSASVAYVSNEGAWPNNGSVSRVDLSNGEVTEFLYEDGNLGVSPGAAIQSVANYSSNGYVVSTGSGGGNLHIVDLTTFKNKASLSFSYPRYIEFNSNSAYLTNGSGAGTVYKISTTSNIVSDSVSVGNGPENLLITDDEIIVANSGGWGLDSSISFINLGNFKVDTTINVGQKPNDLVEDKNGNIWVSCSGLSQWDANGPTAPMLYEINPTTKVILNSYTVGLVDQSIQRIAINKAKDVIYYYHKDGDVFAFNIDGSSLNDPAIITGSFYGLEIDPSTDNILTFDAKGFTADGEMSVYSSKGSLITSYSVGIGANGAFIK